MSKNVLQQCPKIFCNFVQKVLAKNTSIDSGNRLPHNLYVCFKGIEGESLMILLDMNGIQVSTGSACSSGSLTPSSTLTAIGMNKEDIHSCIRLSFGEELHKTELSYVCEKLKESINKLRSLNSQ